jgi:hypothetical protein
MIMATKSLFDTPEGKRAAAGYFHAFQRETYMTPTRRARRRRVAREARQLAAWSILFAILAATLACLLH